MAIELGTRHVRLAHVRREGLDRPLLTLRAWFERTGSEADDLAGVRRSIGLKHYRCTTSMDEDAYHVVQAAAPPVPAAELKSALRWAVKESLDFAADDAIVDALEIPRDGAAAGRPAMVLAVAARRDRVAARIQAFQRSGVALDLIDIAETAQRNVAALFEEADQCLAFLAFTPRGGLLTFTRSGELYAVRRLDVSASALADGAPAHTRQALLERITLELQRSLDNFDRLFSQVALQRLLVAPYPGCAALVAYLAENISLPVAAARLEDVLDCAEEARFADDAETAAWLHPIGLALRDERAIA